MILSVPGAFLHILRAFLKLKQKTVSAFRNEKYTFAVDRGRTKIRARLYTDKSLKDELLGGGEISVCLSIPSADSVSHHPSDLALSRSHERDQLFGSSPSV